MSDINKRPLKVFLCHSSSDKPEVRKWYKRLVADGVDAWLDVESLLPGQKWKEEIPKAIRDSDIVLVCLSKDSINKEGYVQKEIKEALDVADEKPEGTIFIIPARLEECKVPNGLADYHWVDLYNEGYKKLIQALEVRAKAINATLLPAKTSKIEEVKSKAVELERRGNFSESLRAYSELKKLNPAYSGVDEKISEIQNRSNRNRFIPSSIALVVGVVTFLAIFFLFNLPSPPVGPSSTPTVNVASTSKFLPSEVALTPVKQNTKESSNVSTPAIAVLPTEIFTGKSVSMMLVPAGDFIMGSESGDDNNEKPAHTIYLDAFYMDKYEVTNALYKDCVDSGMCTPPQKTISGTRSSYYGDVEFGNYPVITVSWYQAKSYCEWKGSSLPTESQWEKAARGTDGRTYPWGEGATCKKANYCENDTSKVGSYASDISQYGIYDLAGNVSEWTADWYSETYYQISPSSNPFGPASGEYRVVRGDLFHTYGRGSDLNALFSRGSLNPDYGQHYGIGFRCVVDAE